MDQHRSYEIRFNLKDVLQYYKSQTESGSETSYRLIINGGAHGCSVPIGKFRDVKRSWEDLFEMLDRILLKERNEITHN
jgi:hypothetical protein